MSNKHDLAKAATISVSGAQQQGLELSDILLEHPKLLKGHPENTVLFREEDEEYFNRLREDIQARGIIVPLIVKADKTLLAGHNRHRIALELGLTKVPVQYVDSKLSAEEELAFLIKDNLYRRQMGSEEWIYLYRKLFANFDKRIEIKTAGRKPKNEEKGQNSTVAEEEKPLTAKEIAKETGQKERTVQHQIKKHREQLKTPVPKRITSNERIFDDIRFGFTRVYTALTTWEERNPSEEEQNEVYAYLQKRLDDMQGWLNMRQEGV